MKMLWGLIRLTTISLFFCVFTVAQASNSGPRRYARDGLSFEYPTGWKLTDKSNPQAQHLILTSENSSVLIMVIAYRDLIGLPEQLTAARREITEPFISDTAQKLGGSNAKREQSHIKVRDIEIDGVRLQGAVNKESATAEIYSFLEKLRFINLVFIRADKDGDLGNIGWETIRRSLILETPSVGTEPKGSDQNFSGQVLNGRAFALPRPAYPGLARKSHIMGTVVVQITIDEQGNVAEAKAISGPAVFRKPSEEAARGAKFTPTIMYGQPVKVTGVITYSFMPQ